LLIIQTTQFNGISLPPPKKKIPLFLEGVELFLP
jgi:hypothetical protein